MKYLLLAIILLVSCGQPTVEKKPTTYVVDAVHPALQLISIDSCEYLYGDWGNATVFTHKGNCTNPIHPKHLRR